MESKPEVLSLKFDWKTAVNMCLAILESGDHDGKSIARAEILRCAEIADMYVQEKEREGKRP